MRLGSPVLLLVCFVGCWSLPHGAAAQDAALRKAIATSATRLQPKLVAWRRDFHAHPELGNQERRTAGIVAEHLRALGLEVRTGIAQTGVVGILRGRLRGPVVGLRADMDALPVKEGSELPFASRDKGTYRGAEVDLMHACGHDGHVAILMTVAELLTGLKAQLPGTVVFYFQPAEEGPSDFVPDGKKSWGAKLMIEQGALRSPHPDAVFALHLWAGYPAGRIAYRSGAIMASSDDLHIRVLGKQTHAGRPWDGVDPIVVSAQVVLGLQTVISRQTDISSAPTLISLGTIHGGTRYNIIPDSVELEGTIRSYDDAIRRGTHQKARRTIENIAAASGARAEVGIVEKYPPTLNDAALTQRALPSLRWASSDVVDSPLQGGAEDFSFIAREAPGFFFLLGASPKGDDAARAAPNHSPNFQVDEAALIVGVRALSALATDFLSARP
ncbi:MAG: N-acyl-L-amino acid amidohydrolase [Myxococcaceae bacterium]|nr:N-acyl-L-amino acid amidohydrolase [Myxococcaceae bacterium]